MCICEGLRSADHELRSAAHRENHRDDGAHDFAHPWLMGDLAASRLSRDGMPQFLCDLEPLNGLAPHVKRGERIDHRVNTGYVSPHLEDSPFNRRIVGYDFVCIWLDVALCRVKRSQTEPATQNTFSPIREHHVELPLVHRVKGSL